MRPSHEALTLSSSSVWIASRSLVLPNWAKANSPSTSVKARCRSSRRSRKVFSTTACEMGGGRVKAVGVLEEEGLG